MVIFGFHRLFEVDVVDMASVVIQEEDMEPWVVFRQLLCKHSTPRQEQWATIKSVRP